jgi:lysophospholipase L1-like esterase
LTTILFALAAAAGIALSPASAAGAASPHAAGNNQTYAVVDSAGSVLTYSGGGYEGDTNGVALARPIVGAAPDPSGGYWLVASDGGIFTFGSAQFHGSTGAIHLNQPIVGMAATPDGGGYWMVASDGGIFSFGDAQFYGSTGAIHLNRPIVGMASTPDGLGYWLVASDGGIFSFGDAQFYGSTGAIHLNRPIVGMASTGNGGGYWMVASDGGIFAFGNAPFFGSTGGTALNSPIVGMAATPDGGGYWMVGQDSGVFTFGDAGFSPATAQSPLHPPLFPAGFSSPIPPAVTIMPVLPGPSAAHQGRLRVAFAGDSLSFYEGQYTLGTNPPYLLDNAAAPGCGLTNGALLKPFSNPNSIYTDPGACALWASQLQWMVDRFHPDVTVLQAGYWEAQDRLFNGQYQTLASPGYAAYIQSNLEQAVNILHSDGGAVILATSPLFNDGTPTSVVDIYNQIVHAVVSEDSSFVTLFDVYTILSGNGVYDPIVDGVAARTADGVHLTMAGVSQLLTPPLNAIINSVGPPVFSGLS